jgi:hypothetical protein
MALDIELADAAVVATAERLDPTHFDVSTYLNGSTRGAWVRTRPPSVAGFDTISEAFVTLNV